MVEKVRGESESEQKPGISGWCQCVNADSSEASGQMFVHSFNYKTIGVPVVDAFVLDYHPRDLGVVLRGEARKGANAPTELRECTADVTPNSTRQRGVKFVTHVIIRLSLCFLRSAITLAVHFVPLNKKKGWK